MKTSNQKGLTFSSGEWNGFYIEKHEAQRGWMHLYLQFENGQIRGEGTDYVGPWVLNGEYNDSTSECSWTKKYMGRHLVRYHGSLNENGISGTWTIAGTLSGPFHIWPKSFTHLQELYMNEDLERERTQNAFKPSIIPDLPPAPESREDFSV